MGDGRSGKPGSDKSEDRREQSDDVFDTWKGIAVQVYGGMRQLVTKVASGEQSLTVSAQYHRSGNVKVRHTVDRDGVKERVEYTAHGKPISHSTAYSDGNSVNTSFEYDASGRI